MKKFSNVNLIFHRKCEPEGGLKEKFYQIQNTIFSTKFSSTSTCHAFIVVTMLQTFRREKMFSTSSSLQNFHHNFSSTI